MKIVVIGLGTHGRGIARLAVQRGIELVGASSPSRGGEDLGELLGHEDVRGITVVASPAELPWAEHDIDVAVVAGTVDASTFVDIAVDLLERGTNVITLVEHIFTLEQTDPTLAARLHDAAVRAGRTVTATGPQDAQWVGPILQMTASMQSLTGIHITQHLGIDGYDEAFLRACGIGVTHPEFDDVAEAASSTPPFLGGVLPIIAAKLGLTVTGDERSVTKHVLETSAPSTTFGREIPAGDPAGQRDVYTVTTAEGIDLTSEFIVSVVTGQDAFEARLTGIPEVTFAQTVDPGHLSVDAVIVNRLADVVNAQPGFVATVDLPMPHYTAHR